MGKSRDTCIARGLITKSTFRTVQARKDLRQEALTTGSKLSSKIREALAINKWP